MHTEIIHISSKTNSTQYMEQPSETNSHRCSSCTLKHLCIPIGLTPENVEELERVVCFHKPIKRGQAVYTANTPFHAIYAVRVGSFKTTVTARDGKEHVTGFQLSGELLGLDGISNEKHVCDAVALEDSELCVIPFQHLEKLCRERETIQRHFHKIMSSEIIRENGLMLLLGNMHAEERLATFLNNFSHRFKVRGYSPTAFQLRMTRSEIGSYLGMKLETVSRTFSKFQDMGLIAVQNKDLQILDLNRLRHIIGS